jgi:type I restriction enzyme S subunit
MEVKSGYKKSEVGIIPEIWEIAQFSREIEGLDSGVSVNSFANDVGFHMDERAVLKTSAISDGKFFPDESKVIAPCDIGRAKLNPRKDSIIISRMNTPNLVGECGYVFADFPNLFLPDRLWMTRKRNTSEICILWLNYLLSSKPYKTRIKGFATGTSGSMKNIAKDAIFSMLIAYPSSAEQHAIAAAISDVDALLDSLDRLIAKKSDLKQAAMQQLLTGQIRLPGFSGEWEIKRLGDVAKFFKGKGLPKSAITDAGSSKCIHYGELFTNYSETINDIFSHTDLVEGIFLSIANDVLMPTSDVTPRGLAKASCITEDDVILGGDILVIRSDPKQVEGSFLSYLIRYQESKVLQLVTGSTVYHLYASDMKNFTFSIPALEEQVSIVKLMHEMHAELTVLEQRRNKTSALKQGMMQELLTGRTRLV